MNSCGFLFMLLDKQKEDNMGWRDEEYTDMERSLLAEVRRLRSVVRELDIEKRKLTENVDIEFIKESSANREYLEREYSWPDEYINEVINDFYMIPKRVVDDKQS